MLWAEQLFKTLYAGHLLMPVVQQNLETAGGYQSSKHLHVQIISHPKIKRTCIHNLSRFRLISQSSVLSLWHGVHSVFLCSRRELQQNVPLLCNRKGSNNSVSYAWRADFSCPGGGHRIHWKSLDACLLPFTKDKTDPL